MIKSLNSSSVPSKSSAAWLNRKVLLENEFSLLIIFIILLTLLIQTIFNLKTNLIVIFKDFKKKYPSIIYGYSSVFKSNVADVFFSCKILKAFVKLRKGSLKAPVSKEFVEFPI